MKNASVLMDQSDQENGYIPDMEQINLQLLISFRLKGKKTKRYNIQECRRRNSSCELLFQRLPLPASISLGTPHWKHKQPITLELFPSGGDYI